MKISYCVSEYEGGSSAFHAIIEENDKTIKRGGFPCEIHVDKDYTHLAKQNKWHEIISDVKKRSDSDSMLPLLAFTRQYEENYEEILKNFLSSENESLEYEITEIEERLKELKDRLAKNISEFDYRKEIKETAKNLALSIQQRAQNKIKDGIRKKTFAESEAIKLQNALEMID